MKRKKAVVSSYVAVTNKAWKNLVKGIQTHDLSILVQMLYPYRSYKTNGTSSIASFIYTL